MQGEGRLLNEYPDVKGGSMRLPRNAAAKGSSLEPLRFMETPLAILAAAKRT